MKLIDLLVQELPKRGGWPADYKFCVQDGDGDLKFGVSPQVYFCDDEVWRKAADSKYFEVWGSDNGPGYDDGFFNVGRSSDFYVSVVMLSQYEAALAASKQTAWNGEGLPPVGCECEREVPGGWSRCRINYASSALIVYQMLDTGNEYASTLSAFKFRPIHTEAERKREERIKAMYQWAEDAYDLSNELKIPQCDYYL